MLEWAYLWGILHAGKHVPANGGDRMTRVKRQVFVHLGIGVIQILALFYAVGIR
jgi:hypothetical protein